ncbi:cAMP-dependent protein kinase regulator [Paragonimus westermani]|uniref:cGMP-dependent protein kinase n=1 Tax=Paragonimus westermani TaxID=34504 RepID=A0A5J4NVM3_9TREM|nr:cAMP-dependent protein kinase regulator [Paragonimus westermani]
MMDEHSRLSIDLLILVDRFYNAAVKENPRDIISFAANYFNALNTNEKQSDIFDLTSYDISAIHPLIRNLATSTHTEGPDLIGSRPHVFKTTSAPQEWKAPMLRTASANSCSNASDPQIFVTVSDHFKESDSQFSAACGDVPEVFTEDCEERLDILVFDFSLHSSVFTHHQVTINCMNSFAIAAESYDPEIEGPMETAFHPKSTEQLQRLRSVVKPIFIFRSLDDAQLAKVLDAMQEKPVYNGQTIIRQGEDGEYFYVIESGTYDIFVNNEPAGSYNGTGSFGELALMYNTPRAATITCRQDGVLWTVDRYTFRRIVLQQAFRKRQMYETWLASVPLLSNLSAYERTNLADALVSETYEDGSWIIRQGTDLEFVCKRSTCSSPIMIGEEVVLNTLKKGDYFGALDVCSFERLMGPCLDVMRREVSNYRTQLVKILGEACLNTFPALVHHSETGIIEENSSVVHTDK